MNTANKQRVIDFLISTKIDIDFNYFLNKEDFTTAQEVEEILSDNQAFDVEIIYYSRAIEFLKKNDPSLKNSLEIASNMGFDTKNLNSEILASLLASELIRDEFSDIFTELDELCQEIKEEEAAAEGEEEEEA
jgi:intracellular sulfur oxidation DsrE/DsrF family protein